MIAVALVMEVQRNDGWLIAWKLFARAVFTITCYQAGLVCLVFGLVGTGESLVGLGMAVSGVSLIVAARQRLRHLRAMDET